MKLLSGIVYVATIASLSIVSAVEDRHRRKQGQGHTRRSLHSHHERLEKANNQNATVYTNCKASGMVALTFDDGVV